MNKLSFTKKLSFLRYMAMCPYYTILPDDICVVYILVNNIVYNITK